MKRTNKSRKPHTDLTVGSIPNHLLKMTLPLVVGLMANMAYGLVDLYFVGMLGDDELAAMGYVTSVTMLVISASIGLSAGTSSVLARAFGRKDHDEVVRLATISFLLTILIAVTLGFIGLVTIDPLFTLIGANENILPLIRDYITIWYISCLFVIAPVVGMSAMRAMGDTMTQTKINIYAALVNVVLDPILIFGLFGFPRLEIEGAALATVIARGGVFFSIYGFLYYRFEAINFSREVLRTFKSSARSIMHVGIPAAATNMIIPAGNVVLIGIISGYGQDAVAATNVAARIESLCLVFFFALSAVIGPVVGQNLSAHKFDRIEEALKICLTFCLVWGAVLALTIALLANVLASQFSDDPFIIEKAVAYLYLIPLSYGAYGFVMSANASFNGIGRPLPGVIVSTMRTVVLPLPLIYFASLYYDLPVIYGITSACNIIAGTVSFLWVMKTVRDMRPDLAPSPTTS
ncbi:MATE family efflux transporter [Emcibacter sp.]|uniref:MATE family efflux transporter n=1 Tax=Emcibacter sp. TaxID=1979954 RepID=UPI002AA60E7F|nr:MATE family efflux transporter [Emcibacter sp.]